MVKLVKREEYENKSILECKDLSNDIIFRKYNISEGDIIKIENNQTVCMSEKGRVLDIKEEPGNYAIQDIEEIDEEFDKIWKNLVIRKSEDEKLCVIYLNRNIIKHNKYFINDPIKYKNWENNEETEIFINLEGFYDFKIIDPKMLLSKIIGLRNCFTRQELIEKVRKYIISSIEEGINEISEEYKLNIDTLAQNSDKLEIKLKQNEYDIKLLEYGIKLTYFDIKKFEIAKKKFKFF